MSNINIRIYLQNVKNCTLRKFYLTRAGQRAALHFCIDINQPLQKECYRVPPGVLMMKCINCKS